MSGGAFDYKQYQLHELADGIKRVINKNGKTNEWGDTQNYPPEILEEFETAIKLLDRAAIYVQRIDWLVSGDDGEESFQSRLKQELAELSPTPVEGESRE